MSENEFSVFWWDPTGSYHKELGFVSAEAAMEKAISLTRRPAALIGVIRKVMITDGGDFCVFLWEFGKGVVFPTKEEIEAK